MTDQNKGPIKYFLKHIKQFDESTLLNSNLQGSETPKLNTIELKMDKNSLDTFCINNSIKKSVLFLASACLALNKFNFSNKNLIFHENDIIFTTNFENRKTTIEDYLMQIQKDYEENLKYCDFSIDDLIKEYNLKSGIYYSFDKDLDLDSSRYSYDFYINIKESSQEFILSASYNDQLYSSEYVELFLETVITIISQFLSTDISSSTLSDIYLVKEDEDIEFDEIETPFIHKRFEKQVESKGDEIALVATNETLTYYQLNEKANRIANALIQKGAKPRSNILIMLPRESNLIATILGILKAGCTFIPLDLEYPIERIRYIYENSQADYIITNDGTSENNLDINELLKEENNTNPDINITPEDLAYMIYTSGSTGKPKGVMISHENICNQVSNPKSTYNSLLCITTISFDVSVDDILTSLSNGLKLILADDSQIKNIPALIRLIDENKPEILDSTPSRLASYLEVKEFCNVISCLKCIFIGGEKFSAKVYEDLRKYSDAVIYNSYGPTETTITSNNKLVTDAYDLTVGLPLTNYVTDVRDIDGKLLPDGVMGELYIGGTGVGKGYYGMPEKTKDVFRTINDIPYYRSGDYAIKLPNGEIDIKGRIDDQIKLRGLRIEIEEIETNIARFPNIKHTAVVIKKINDTEHLCAYFTADEKIDIQLLKRYLKNKLTKYMIPSVFMQMDELPQTPNGKTDLKQLPEPELNLEYIKPETETEKKIFKLVSELMDGDAFGITDDLYSLGFTSLTLMKLNSMIYNETDVNIDINTLFSNPTVKSLANTVDNDIKSDLDINKIIAEANDMDYFPLTSNQLGIYYECMQTEKIKYTLPYVIRFGSDVDSVKLKNAIIKTIEAHPYLKTRIVNVDGDLKQKRYADGEIDEIEIINIDSISNTELMEREVKAFPIENNQLFRFRIYETPEETVLFSDFHHIITDGESQSMFFKDVEKAYNGEEIEPETIDGYAYSLIQVEIAENEVSEKFFKNKISDGIESSVLTPNINGNPETGEIKLMQDRIDSTFVRHFCKDHSISPNVLFMAATTIALNKFTFSDKSLITTIFNGRGNPGVFGTQAMLVKTFPVIINSENRDMMIEDFIRVVDSSWKDVLIHSDYPYTKLSHDYQLKPEFFYSYNQDMDRDIININGKSYDSIALDGTVETDYKINLNIYDDGQDISIYLEYNDQLYTEDYIKMFMNAIKYILVQFFVNDMDKICIKDIELGDSSEVPTLKPIDNPILHKRFEKQVKVKGDEIALVATDETLTYNQLNEKANRIANALIQKGVKPRNNILIMLPRESNLIATILGILKAGCTFIPLDLEYPIERIRYIYENSQADYIITNDGTSENNLDINELLKEENNTNPDINITPEDLAYMIYTSGSTGKPKGVMISHENACNQAGANPKCEYNNLLSIATIAFDTSLEDILTGLTNGIKIIFANDTEIKNVAELTNLINKNQPEVMEFTPSRLLSYLEIDEFCKAINCAKCIVMGGEQFSANAFTKVKQYTDAKVYNSYGPTEITIASNYKQITDENNITIGPALRNYITDVRDIDGKLLPDGVMGELYIGGTGVGKGYYNMPDKTKEVFLTLNDIPYYRSGDYAIKLPNGEIDIKGRIDGQIKLRGLRIEIGEIEYNINQFNNIKRVAVVIKNINGNDHLCAYFTSDDKINTDDLKSYLEGKLTQYMVPTVFMQLDEMPETPSGKIDAKSLPDIDVNKLRAEYVAPTSKTEEIVVNAFENVFNQAKIGINDDFLMLGGDSLSAIRIISLLSEEDITVTVNTILSNKTPREIAYVIDGGASQYGFNLVKKGTKDQNMFFIPPISGTSFLYLAMIDELEFEGNIYIIDDFKFTLPIEEMKKTDSQMCLEKYYEAIKDVFQDGDIIAAYSQGCIYSIMISAKLEQEKKIGKILLIDGDLKFKETNKADREEVMGLVNDMAQTDFDLEELFPEPFEIFLEKVIVVSIINSVWDFEPVSIESPVIYFGTEGMEENLFTIAPNAEFIPVDANHYTIIDKDRFKIIEYFK